MANPFFQNPTPRPAPAQPGASPRRGGLAKFLTAGLGAKQAYAKIMSSGGDPNKIMAAVLAMPAFKNYNGPRDPQSIVTAGLQKCGLDVDDLAELAREAGFDFNA